VVRPDILYSQYFYVTSQSQMMKAHFAALWADISQGRAIKSVLEIGSNDGTLLNWIKRECGIERVWGIEPAQNLADVGRKAGVRTFSGFFRKELAEALAKPGYLNNEPFDLILARHVLCHVDDWHDFFAGIGVLCGPQTLVCIENPWVQDILDSNSFDQIYHEHLSYLSIRAIEAVLKTTGLHLHRVIHYTIHGGAMVLMIERNDCGHFVHPSVAEFRQKEDVDLAKWLEFDQRCKLLRRELTETVLEFGRTGKTVAALGASAKSTVWINACGFTRKDIAWVADSTPGKQRTTVPGTDIPVVDEGAILRELPDYVLVFCWNFRAEVLEKNQFARSKGVKFIFPIPELEIV
jgi:SAM-dependent methyltransferase